jgi:MFS family permease
VPAVLPPKIPRQPFDEHLGDDAEKWTLRDEAERLDRLATLIAQASLALAAGAIAAGFSLERHSARIFVFVVAAACGAIALAAGTSLAFHPMRHAVRVTQESSLRAKLRLVRAAGVSLGVAVPSIACVVGAALFAPNSGVIFGIVTLAFAAVGLVFTTAQDAKFRQEQRQRKANRGRSGR